MPIQQINKNAMNTIKATTSKLKAKRTFLKKGTCSRTFFYLLNREFGHPNDEAERAVDPLAGGIMQQGYQCGMLWGASMAVGAESYRKTNTPDRAVALSIEATQHIMESFLNRTESIECEDITSTDFKNKLSFAKYMLSGKFVSCFTLAGKWAPEAIQSAVEGLSGESTEADQESFSCASEVVKQMGGSEEEAAMVSGFAGGLGLSGDACGALAAAIWKTALDAIRSGNYKPSYSDPTSDKVLSNFYKETDYEIECREICRKRFNTIQEHSEFIKNGGCKKLISVLAES